jgi:hypothetical protein
MNTPSTLQIATEVGSNDIIEDVDKLRIEV